MPRGKGGGWMSVETFEREYGFKPDIPPESRITMVRETPEGVQITYTGPVSPEPRTVETLYGVDLPEGARVTGVAKTAEGYEISYVQPTLEVAPKPTRYPVASLAYRQIVEGRVQPRAGILERQIIEGRVSPEKFGIQEEAEVTKAYKAGGQLYIEYVLPPKPVKEEPKGLGEFLAGISIQEPLAHITSAITGTPVKRIIQIQQMQKKVMPPSLRPVEPVKEVGGWVASVEAPVYSVGRLVGLETPRPPPTVTGGLIGVALGDPSELEKVKAYGPEYARGTILGDIAVSLALGWAVGKAWIGAKKIPVVKKAPLAVERAKHAVTEAIIKKAPKRLQKWYFGPAYKQWKMTQELVWEKKPFAGYEEFYLTTETMLPTKPPAEQWLLVTKGARITPMAITLAKVGAFPTFGGLMPPQQIVVTEPAKHVPFDFMRYPITKAPPTLATSVLTRTLLGFGVATGLKAITPKMVKEAPKLRTVVAPTIKARERQFLNVEQIMGVQTVQRQKQLLGVQQIQTAQQVQRTLQVQRQAQAQIFAPKLLQKAASIKPPWFRLPEVFGRRRGGKDLFGAWFYKRHPILKPKQVARRFLFEDRKRRRKKRAFLGSLSDVF